MADKKKEFVQISAEDYVSVKATPESARKLMNQKIVDRTNNLNAKRRQQEMLREQKKYETEEMNKLPRGGVVAGSLSVAEKEAMQTGDELMMRKVAILRQKALRLARENRMKGKSYQALSKRQGQLPQSPYHDRDGYLEE